VQVNQGHQTIPKKSSWRIQGGHARKRKQIAYVGEGGHHRTANDKVIQEIGNNCETMPVKMKYESRTRNRAPVEGGKEFCKQHNGAKKASKRKLKPDKPTSQRWGRGKMSTTLTLLHKQKKIRKLEKRSKARGMRNG